MRVNRSLYILLALAVGAGIFFGAQRLHNDNLTNMKTVENFFRAYEDRYQYNRYVGQPKFTALINTVIHNDKVEAAPDLGTATTVPVLLYHRIANDKDPYNVTPANFKAQMFALKKAGYTPVTIYDYSAFINGTRKLPAKSFLLTFDDGTKDSFYPVQPVLQALGFHATNFVITRYSIDNPAGSHYYLSTIELKQMAASGLWDLQPHTRNGHTYYPISPANPKGEYYPNKLWLASQHRLETDQEYASRVYNDMLGAKQDVQKVTHQPGVAFAFPFGTNGEDNTSNYPGAYATLTSDVQKLFKTAMLQTYGGRGKTQNYYGSNSTYTYRMEADASWPKTPGALLANFDRGAAKTIPYNDNLQADNGWLKGDGQVSVSNGTLNVASVPGTNGGSALLDGTSAWTNYTVSATATLVKGTSFDFTVRNQGSAYRIGCDFSNNYISVERQVGDQTTTLIDDNYALPVNVPNRLGVEVNGQNIKCLENGVVVAETTDAAMPARGGPGFTVWDPKQPSLVQINDIAVTPAAELS